MGPSLKAACVLLGASFSWQYREERGNSEKRGPGLPILALLLASQGLAQCEGWNTSPFFLSATAAEVGACLAVGADPNARTIGLGYAPLHLASGFNDDPATIAGLIAAGADLGAREKRFLATPLHLAARYNKNPLIAATLVKAGAEVDSRNRRNSTPLHLAVRFNEPAVIEALLDAGADATARDAEGKTPWDYAQENEALRGTDAWWRLREGGLD